MTIYAHCSMFNVQFNTNNIKIILVNFHIIIMFFFFSLLATNSGLDKTVYKSAGVFAILKFNT